MFFFLHYFFASITAHASALFPVFIGAAVVIPGASPAGSVLLLAYTLGLMHVLTPYASGPSAIYYSGGYIKARDFWVFGLILGLVFFLAYVVIVLPWLAILKV
ncbi:MAG: anion permease [bacterium]